MTFSQSPYSQINLSRERGVSANQVSLKNPYFGSRFSYDLDPKSSVQENFLFTAKVLYVPVSGDRWALPVALIASPTGGDISIPESGINIGIFPWYKLINKDQFTLLAHGGVSYKSLKESGSPEINQIRALAGLEVAFTGSAGGSPITLSVTPVFSHTDNLADKTVIEITGVLPISKNLATLVDYRDNSFRIGVMVGLATK